jgi:polyphosphate kinase
MRGRLLEAIWDEVRRHRKHGDGRLIFKMNSLVDREVIRALYAASREGVEIDLIVRGICCLRPGMPGVSETIRVVSLVGRFLEHSRIYWFHSGDRPKLYLGSADAMERNFDRRVEVLFPIGAPELGRHLRDVVLDAYLRDTVNARTLGTDEVWRPKQPVDGTAPFDAQAWFMKYYRDHVVLGAREDHALSPVEA